MSEDKIKIKSLDELTDSQKWSFKAVKGCLLGHGAQAIYVDTLGFYGSNSDVNNFFMLYNDEQDSLNMVVCACNTECEKAEGLPEQNLEEAYSLVDEYIKVQGRQTLEVEDFRDVGLKDIKERLVPNALQVSALIPSGGNNALVRVHRNCFNGIADKSPQLQLDTDFDKKISKKYLDNPDKLEKETKKYCGLAAHQEEGNSFFDPESFPDSYLSVKEWYKESHNIDSDHKLIPEKLNFEQLYRVLQADMDIDRLLPKNIQLRIRVFTKLDEIVSLSDDFKEEIFDKYILSIERELASKEQDMAHDTDRNALASEVSAESREENISSEREDR